MSARRPTAPVITFLSDYGLGDEFVFFAEFEHQRGARHTIALFVEPRGGGTVKHIGLLRAMNELDSDGPFHPNALETIDISAAGALIREVLERTYGPRAAASDDFRVLIASARARSIMLHAQAGSD